LSDIPTDQDLLEQCQRAMLQQQEDDLRQMKTSRRLRPGSLHGNFQVILLSAAHVSTSYVS